MGCVDLVYMLYCFLCVVCFGVFCGSKVSFGVGFYVLNYGVEVLLGFVCICVELEVRWYLMFLGIRKDVFVWRCGRELNCNIFVDGVGIWVRFGFCEFKLR